MATRAAANRESDRHFDQETVSSAETQQPVPHSQNDMPLESVSAATLSSLRILSALCIALPALVFIAVGLYRYEQIRTESELRLDRTLRVADEHALKVLDTNMV